MQDFPILYSRDSKGNVRIWKMQQKDDKYRTISGLEFGEQVISEWSVALPKNTGKINATTNIEQSAAEIEAKYKKQLKTGYFHKITDIDKELYISPMLCKGFIERLNKVIYPVIVDRKYNGGRCITSKRGMFSRKGEPYVSTTHIWESIYPLFEEYPDLVLDGEFYNHDYRFKLNEIMKLIRKSVHITYQDLQESRAKIKYYVYDAYGFESITKDTKQFERRSALKELLKGFEFIEIVEGQIANNEKEVYDIYQEYLDDGYEGAIIRLNCGYENKRSANLLKLKPEDSDEAIIVDILEGDGNWSKTGKILKLKWKNKVFNATFKGTYEEGVQFLKDRNKWLGKEITFLYNGLTGLKIPNFARMDIDNNTNEK